MTAKDLKETKSIVPQKGISPLGFENYVDDEDLKIPRAKLVQSMTPELKEKSVNGLAEGMFINSLTKEILPERFTPVFVFTEWIRFNPRERKSIDFNPEFEPGEIIWRSKDPTDPRVIEESKWGENREPPKAMKVLNFLCHFENTGMPLILGFSKTSLAAGQSLWSMCKFSGLDMFARSYKLGSVEKSSDGNTYKVATVTPAGNTDEDIYLVCKQWHKDLSGRSHQIITEVED